MLLAICSSTLRGSLTLRSLGKGGPPPGIPRGPSQNGYRPLLERLCPSSGTRIGNGDVSVTPAEGECETHAESSISECVSEEKGFFSSEEGEGNARSQGKRRRSSLRRTLLKRGSKEKETPVEPVVVTDAVVPAGGRFEKVREVVVMPLRERPIFPRLNRHVIVRDSKLIEKLTEDKMADRGYVGAFLVKDLDQKPAWVTESWAGNKVEGSLKGEALYQQLHEYGTFCKVVSIYQDVYSGQTTVTLLGHMRLRLKGLVSEDPLTVSVEWTKDKPFDQEEKGFKAIFLEVIARMNELMMLSPLFKEAVSKFLLSNDPTPPNVANAAIGLAFAAEGLVQQQGLEELDVLKRLTLALMILKKEIDISKLQASIAKAIEDKITGEQRRFLLLEQLKAIKKELGLETDDKTTLTAKFQEKLDLCKDGCPDHVVEVIEDELAKLQLLEASSTEFNVTRSYLDWLTSMPWGKYSEENFDVRRAQRILDEDHYGLSDVKERISEFIAVGKLRGISQGKIICLCGPPGVGKTSIGRSIARALNRKFFRFSVGGLSDVAEIKGHRRTYVGAMPGKMVQCLKTTGTANPLVLIDEIDKLGRGYAADPASSLLELLDPEQNANFLDYYLDVPIDLSKVLFICTANLVESIPGPLLDRMEVIPLVGYISDEKMHIACAYLEPAARKSCGIRPEQAGISKGALHSLIENYCREAGVRNLQKHIEKIYRKIALQLVLKDVEIHEEASLAHVPSKTDVMSMKHADPVVLIENCGRKEQLVVVTGLGECKKLAENEELEEVTSQGETDELPVGKHEDDER